MTSTQKFITLPILGGLMLLGGGIAGYVGMVSADTSTSTSNQERHMFDNSTPHVGGEVTAVNGTTITVTDQRKGGTYTIEAASATIEKDGTTSDISAIAVGDRVMAVGTLSGTTLTATNVMGGMGRGGHGGPDGRGHGVMGSVTAVDGTTITVTGKDGQSYTVNAGSASVRKMVAGALSDIAVGDTIGVQGTVSGTNVTATQIMDDLPAGEAGLPQPPAQQ